MKINRREYYVEKLNVAIADDNERMLRELGDIVRSDEGLQVVGTAKDGEIGRASCRERVYTPV